MKIQNDPINFFNYLHNHSFPTLSVLQEQKIIDTLFVLFVLYLITSAMNVGQVGILQSMSVYFQFH